MFAHWSRNRRILIAAALVLAVSGTGCSNRLYPVRGKVTLDDGTTLQKGLVIFESQAGEKPVSARGEIQSDGSYQLATFQPGDGLPPGKYRVLVNPLDLSDVPDEKKNLPFDVKYTKFDTSGLEYEVKPSSNDIPIQLARGRKGRR